MEVALLIDFGSTYTKVAVVDLDEEKLVDWTQAVSTVDEDITIGLNKALSRLRVADKRIEELDVKTKLACSSAAGGLRIITIGLVPSLTTKAATQAALGAGAKVVGTYCYELAGRDIADIETHPCDMILLAGGTDGGDQKTILHNADMLTRINSNVPIIVAGNRVVSGEVGEILSRAGKEAIVTENVLPGLDVINVDPCRSAIRQVFMDRIIHAKGLDKAKEYVTDIVMPTPAAVLAAAQLVAEGTKEEEGLGSLIVADVGGATTDVCSIAHGHPTRAGALLKGLPEPYAKRTVEGDLGIRYSAHTILNIVGEPTLRRNLPATNARTDSLDLERTAEYLSRNIGFVPEKEMDFLVDAALSRCAVELATERHAGYIQQVHLPSGRVEVQYGKDLSNVEAVIGTGGVFVHSPHSRWTLQAALCDHQQNPFSLKPRAPRLYVDGDYILFAAGLLARIAPTSALRMVKKSLKVAGTASEAR